ncbi:MAG: cell division protein FtsQ/DivIB [Hyphomonadaceae bacterium]|nr:cell division protein FtsQ/DivIB [Hyphomonadaceae bacterium]
MPQVRARRRRAGGGDDYRREPPQAPRKPRGTPRLAAIQLDGDFKGPKVTRKGATNFAAATALLLGAAVAGAALIGGSLFDVRQAAAGAADGAIASAGLHRDAPRITDWHDRRLEGAREAEVAGIVAGFGGASLMSVDPQDLRAQLESLDWIARVRVTRLWPSTLKVEVERRREMARWQENGAVSVIDANGERLFAERAADHLDLPLVVGEGAGPVAAPVLGALERYPAVRERTRAFVRVGARRWDMKLASGATVALPEENPSAALAELDGLHARYRLLDRPLDRIDMRLRGRIGVRLNPVLAGASRTSEGRA